MRQGVLYVWEYESIRCDRCVKEIGKEISLFHFLINPIGQLVTFFIFWLGSFTKVAIVGGCPQIIRKLEKIMYILLYFTDVNQFYSHVW